MSNRLCFVFVKLAVVSAFVVTMVVAGCGGGNGPTDAGDSVPGGGADGGPAPAGGAGDGGGFQIWVSVASSADGTKLVAVSNGNINYNNINNLGYIYTSTDSGVTWKQTGPQTNWTSVASSADGTKLVAAAMAYTVDGHEASSDDPLVGGGLYTSSDSGATWTLTGSSANILSPDWSQGVWHSVASSADGTKLVAWEVERIYTSVNSGVTWKPAALPFVLTVSGSVASSADGTKLIAVSGSGSGTPGIIRACAGARCGPDFRLCIGKEAAMTLLDSLKKQTVIVADTGDIEAIAMHKPQDATTNPSLLLKVAPLPQYRALIDEAVKYAVTLAADESRRRSAFMEKLAVNFGFEILKIIPGRVSTEVDASLSFDTEGTIAKARNFIELYRRAGVAKERILIKVGTTWEGIRAAEQLEREGIHCNMTLLFSFAQAVAAAEAKATLISPFVGRIYDYYLKERGVKDIPPEQDPGVASVVRIYNHYKKFDYATQVMGASFRKTEQVMLLAGCDLLTISPDILADLEKREGELPRRLSVEAAKASDATPLHLDEKAYRFMHNQDAMAVDKLSDGIRHFYADARKLEKWAADFLDKVA